MPYWKLLKGWTDIAHGAPEVIARRTHMLSQPWSASTMIESNRMVTEKMMAATEAWWSLWRDTMKPWPAAGTGSVWLPLATSMALERAVACAVRATHPISRRVRANRARLRKGSKRY